MGTTTRRIKHLMPTSHLDFVFKPRLSLLRKCEGIFRIKDAPIGRWPNDLFWLRDMLANIEGDQSPVEIMSSRMCGRTGLFKWLTKIGIKEPVIQKIQQVANEYFSIREHEIHISCRYNDILRMSDTKAYESCLADYDMNELARVFYLDMPCFGIMYIPDRAGKFKWRILIALVQFNDGNGKKHFGLRLSRIYGPENGPKILPLFGNQLLEKLPKEIEAIFSDGYTGIGVMTVEDVVNYTPLIKGYHYEAYGDYQPNHALSIFAKRDGVSI